MSDPTSSTAPAARSTGLRASLGVLRRHRDFRRLYIASLISLGGDWFLTVALFDVVLRLEGTATSVALVIIAQELPSFLAAPAAGYLVDRLDRRRLMVVCDLARAVLVLGFLLIGGESDLWLVYVLLPFITVFSTAFDPAMEAAMPNLVPSEDLGPAYSLVGSAWGTMLAVGAAIGGLVVAGLGSTAAFAIDAASFALSAAMIFSIRSPFAEPHEGEHPRLVEATLETVTYARRDHRVLALLVVKGGFGLGAGVLVLLSVFAERIFLAGAVGIGLLMGARGAGALVGPFLGRAIAGDDDRRLFAAIGIALATFGISYVAFGFTPTIAVALPVVFCAHLGGGGQWTLSTYGLQRLVPDRLRGRIFSFDFALVTLSIAISSLVTGWAADRFGPRPAAIGLGAVALAWAITWWFLTGDIRRGGGLSAPSFPDSRNGA
ncbi:MAG: MFS transporter [Actinomycetota bacterium]